MEQLVFLSLHGAFIGAWVEGEGPLLPQGVCTGYERRGGCEQLSTCLSALQ